MRSSQHSRSFHQRPEVRLDRVQIVWLTLGAVVALGLVFALGMLIGRRAERIASAPPSESLAHIDEDQAIHRQIKREEKPLKFYEELAKTDHSASSQPRSVPVEKAPVEPSDHGEKQRTKAVTAEEKMKSLASAVARTKSLVNTNGAIRKQLDEGPAERGDYTVQVSAFQTESEAAAYAAGLKRKGFSPFVVSNALEGKGIWYRVRMGRFTTEESAKAAKNLLAQADIPAWVLRAE